MNRQRIVHSRRTHLNAHLAAFGRLDAALERDARRRRNDPAALRQEEEKLTEVRLALFGSAPK